MSRYLFLFAVVHEAKPFLRRLRRSGLRLDTTWYQNLPFLEPACTFPGGEVWITGMGQKNAANTMRAILCSPMDRIITCGFAGGLGSDLSTRDVLYSADPDLEEIEARLRLAGARPGRFTCEPRVAVTSREKLDLRIQTGADAVEMESGIIRQICRSRGIPSMTVRVISDAASEDLPMDFNALMTPDMRIDKGRLFFQLAGAPWRIPDLIQFNKRVTASAEALADVLFPLVAAQVQPQEKPSQRPAW